MKRLFFARCLVYGSLAACLGTLAWIGRGSEGVEATPVVTSRWPIPTRLPTGIGASRLWKSA